MQTITELPVAANAGRILTGTGARKLLDRFLLPSYGWLLDWLAEARDRAFVGELWEGVFLEPMPYDNVFDAEVAFAQRVNEELFPVDLAAMDGLLGSDEPVLSYPIQIFTYGVPWEIACTDEIAECDVPMVAVIRAAGLFEDSELFQVVMGSYDPREAFEDWLRDWWARQGFETEPVLTWPRDRERAMARLRQLPSPLNGLAGVYASVVKGTGSIFYDWPGGYYQCEYSNFDYYCWCPACVKDLAGDFAVVRDDVRRMEAYHEWFDGAGPDRRRVIRALVGLEEVTDG